MSLPPGTTLGSFQVLAPLGAGGMGEVYRARDVRLGREVAIKVLPSELATDRERLARFASEARATSALNHPNIVTIYEVGQASGCPYIAMELVDGKTLRSMIDPAMPLRKIFQIAAQLGDGLAKAHEASIVHRDLKPENIMVTKDGYVKVLDFGLAKLTGAGAVGEQGLTGTGLVVGTAGYMSPEQASGRVLDFRSDQFSLGLILYEMATGRKAFEKGTAVQTLTSIIQDEPEPIQRLNPKMPAPFCWIIDRCLSKDPEERYSSTRDLARDLRNIKDHLSVVSDKPSAASATTAAHDPAGPVQTHKLPTGPQPAPRNVGEPSPTAKGSVVDLARAFDLPSTSPTPAVGMGPATEILQVPLARRLGALALYTLLGLVLFAAGAGAAYWLLSTHQDPPPPQWTGELLLGGATRAFSPRISPDGQTLAFVTIVNGVTQVAVMKPGTGDWIVLTKERGLGSVNKMDWSRDGTKIVYDRITDMPRGIFSIAAIGGEERLVLDDAQGPESLPDGTLLVLKIDAKRHFQLHRFTSDSGKLDPVGPAIQREGPSLLVRAFPDGKEALFFGKLAADTSPSALRQAYAVSLASGEARRFAPELPILPPFSITAAGSVLADIASGDLHQIFSVSRDGTSAHPLLTLPTRPAYVNDGPDGSLYLGLIDNPIDLLKFPVTGGVPQRLTSSARNLFLHPVQFADGRTLLPSLIAGRQRLLVAQQDEPLRPFVDTSEQSAPPVALLPDDRVVFLTGGTASQPYVLAIASCKEGRVLKRLDETKGIVPRSLSASPDGQTLYLVDAGKVLAVDVTSGKKSDVCDGNGVTVDPSGTSLIVQVNGKDGVKLFRKPLPSGDPQPINVQAELRLSPSPIGGSSIGPDGRLVVTVSRLGSWFSSPALLDPVTGFLELVPVQYDGDIFPTTFTKDGMLLGRGAGLKCELWRLRPRAAPGQSPEPKKG